MYPVNVPSIHSRNPGNPGTPNVLGSMDLNRVSNAGEPIVLENLLNAKAVVKMPKGYEGMSWSL